MYQLTTGTYNDGKRGFQGWNEELIELLLQIGLIAKIFVYFIEDNVVKKFIFLD